MKKSKVQIAIALITLVIVVGTMASLASNSTNENYNNVVKTKERVEMIDPEAVMINKEYLVPIKDVNDPYPNYTIGIIETITTQGGEGEEIFFIKLENDECYYKFTAEEADSINALKIGDKVCIDYQDTSKLFKNSVIR